MFLTLWRIESLHSVAPGKSLAMVKGLIFPLSTLEKLGLSTNHYGESMRFTYTINPKSLYLLRVKKQTLYQMNLHLIKQIISSFRFIIIGTSLWMLMMP